jgi:hypothetical protein
MSVVVYFVLDRWLRPGKVDRRKTSWTAFTAAVLLASILLVALDSVSFLKSPPEHLSTAFPVPKFMPALTFLPGHEITTDKGETFEIHGFDKCPEELQTPAGSECVVIEP